jgi:hypothetical protein
VAATAHYLDAVLRLAAQPAYEDDPSALQATTSAIAALAALMRQPGVRDTLACRPSALRAVVLGSAGVRWPPGAGSLLPSPRSVFSDDASSTVSGGVRRSTQEQYDTADQICEDKGLYCRQVMLGMLGNPEQAPEAAAAMMAGLAELLWAFDFVAGGAGREPPPGAERPPGGAPDAGGAAAAAVALLGLGDAVRILIIPAQLALMRLQPAPEALQEAPDASPPAPPEPGALLVLGGASEAPPEGAPGPAPRQQEGEGGRASADPSASFASSVMLAQAVDAYSRSSPLPPVLRPPRSSGGGLTEEERTAGACAAAVASLAITRWWVCHSVPVMAQAGEVQLPGAFRAVQPLDAVRALAQAWAPVLQQLLPQLLAIQQRAEEAGAEAPAWLEPLVSATAALGGALCFACRNGGVSASICLMPDSLQLLCSALVDQGPGARPPALRPPAFPFAWTAWAAPLPACLLVPAGAGPLRPLKPLLTGARPCSRPAP